MVVMVMLMMMTMVVMVMLDISAVDDCHLDCADVFLFFVI